MTALNRQQLERLWVQAGGDKKVAPVMAAIALAESHGDPNVRDNVNSNGTRDRGLWQINSSHTRLWSAQLRDPLANARAAVSVYNSQGFGAWATYKSGDFRKYLTSGGGGGGGGVTGTAKDVAVGLATNPFYVTEQGAKLVSHVPIVGGLFSSAKNALDIPGAIEGAVIDVEHFAVKESVVALGYIVFTSAALALFVLGALRATGVSATELVGAKAGAGGGGPRPSGVIPY